MRAYIHEKLALYRLHSALDNFFGTVRYSRPGTYRMDDSIFLFVFIFSLFGHSLDFPHSISSVCNIRNTLSACVSLTVWQYLDKACIYRVYILTNGASTLEEEETILQVVHNGADCIKKKKKEVEDGIGSMTCFGQYKTYIYPPPSAFSLLSPVPYITAVE